jgi:hypothetical protein
MTARLKRVLTSGKSLLRNQSQSKNKNGGGGKVEMYQQTISRKDEMKISDKANKLIENLRKFAVQDEIGGRINKVAGARVASFELEDYIAKLEAENRALRHALELRECEETEHKPDPLDGVPFVSLSNEEIAAMTPEHPLYKLVKGKEERNGQ